MIALEIIVPVIFVAGISYCLLTAIIPVRGRVISKAIEPGTYWLTLGFGVICVAAILGEIIFPNWGFAVLRAARVIK